MGLQKTVMLLVRSWACGGPGKMAITYQNLKHLVISVSNFPAVFSQELECQEVNTQVSAQIGKVLHCW
jgi:hypothetical protein